MPKVLISLTPHASTLKVECTGVSFALLSQIESHACQIMNDYRPARSERSDTMTLTYELGGADENSVANELLGQIGIFLGKLNVGELTKLQDRGMCGYSW